MEYLLSHLLENSAKTHADRVALEFEKERLTYAELRTRVGALAATFASHGLKPGDRVGVHVNKGIDTVVALCAALHVGAVFVPLDPTAPAPRTSYILQDCGVRVVVTDAEKLERLAVDPTFQALEFGLVVLSGTKPAAKPSHVAALVDMAAACSGPDRGAPVRRVSTDLAYILYTSGSTGKPKGVMVSHLAALTFVQWASSAFAICETDVLSNHAPFHFDLSTFDLYCALKCGARVVLLPEWASAFPGRLVKQMAERGITVWYSVPSALILMLNRGKLAEATLPALRVILFAGEVFPVKYLRQLHETIPHARLFNLYGPTETNVCTYYEVKGIPADRTEPFPIGKAIDNHDCFVLNAEGQRCAAGQEGELVVRGPGLMSGYWNMPERTAQSLHVNPAPLESSDLIYRTGDLCREDADGNFVYVGRIDHMVKIRGYRVELGEVEAVLLAHPNVREAAVVPVTDGELNSQLRAHIAHDGSTTAEELTLFAAQRLPKYMVPELWVLENSLPKTSTGKIDRQKLGQLG